MISSDLEVLQAKMLEKTVEVTGLATEITRAKLDAQQLRLRLLAHGVQDASLTPSEVRAGPQTADASVSELRDLVRWLSETVDLTRHAVFDVASEVTIGERYVHLGRMLQWSLPNTEGQKLSVPLEMQEEIGTLLSTTRSRGKCDLTTVARFSEAWEIVGAEVVASPSPSHTAKSPSPGRTEPAIFLVHRETAQAIVVATWPSVDFGWSTMFDPRKLFERHLFFEPRLEQQHRPDVVFPTTRPPTTTAMPQQVGVSSSLASAHTLAAQASAQTLANAFAAPWLFGGQLASGACSGLPVSTSSQTTVAGSTAHADGLLLPRPRVSSGDRVEVQYDGQWYIGTLQWVTGDLASVKCDVDAPGVLTMAPVTSVRQLTEPQASSSLMRRSRSLHARAKSMM